MLRRATLLLCSALLTGAGDAPRPVRITTVSLVQPGQAVTLSGTLQARILADLAFRVGGKVIERPVDIGQTVHAGQMLARLDPSDLRLNEQVAAAALQAAEADAANARASLARYEALGRTSPAYLPSDYDSRVAASRMADARLAQASRQLILAHDQSGYGTLVADADGVITALPVQVGQVVAAGQTVASLAHTGEIEAVVDVPENRLQAVRSATDVTITLWAAPQQTLHGRVREIGAQADAATRTFTAKITVLDAPPGLLALGMTAAVRFNAARPPVAVLPAAAVTDQDGHPAVWVLDPQTHRATQRPVQVAGYAGDGTAVIAAGLQDGDQVVTAGAGQIEPGMALTAWAGATR